MISGQHKEVETEKNRLLESLKFPVAFILAIWGIHLLQYFLGLKWGFLGVYPRKVFGLKGIITAPFIHGDFSHLFNNTIPFFVLATMTLYFYRKVAIRSIAMIYILTGIAVWLLARETFHIGLSGVVFGLFGFVLGNGIFRRNIRSIVLALIVFLLYSGMLVGLFPTEEGVSWESHASGFVIGLFTAYFYKEELEAEEIKHAPWEDEPDLVNQPYFFPRDVFEKTKAQRIREAAEERARQQRRDEDGWISDSTIDL